MCEIRHDAFEGSGKYSRKFDMRSLKFNGFLHTVADSGREFLRGRLLSKVDFPKSAIDLCHELLSTLGEASGTAIARDIVECYLDMGIDQRMEFFESLKTDFDVNHEAVLAAAEEYRRQCDEFALIKLAEQVEPRRQELLRRINMAPNGTATIVDMRRDLLYMVNKRPHLSPIDADLKHLLSSWFNRGFLTLEKINWETPAIILEKLIEHETVHAMKGWTDLRNRLAEDRRCFAFFHPALPYEPLVFVEVALAKGLATSIDPIIDHKRKVSCPSLADTAIFYSINNCLEGLHGISFGNFLIKQVVQELSHEFPGLRNYSTLSPMPGFCKWLKGTIGNSGKYGIPADKIVLLARLESDSWFANSELVESLKPLLTRLAAYYLTKVKKGNQPLDPVARFHLRNGARLERINWLADYSKNGIRQSAGMLVNYIYRPDDIVSNHESYVKGNTLAISQNVVKLVPRTLQVV